MTKKLSEKYKAGDELYELTEALLKAKPLYEQQTEPEVIVTPVVTPRQAIASNLDTGDRARALEIAGNDPELLKFFIRYVPRKREPGEQIKRSESDHPPYLTEFFEELLAEAKLIKERWKENGIRVAEPMETALKFLLRGDRQDVRNDVLYWLKSFRSNKSKREKRKARARAPRP